ncbi:MAG TPA: glycosyltransferase family 9 protein [Candidatus Nanoarchaeia archaeon]|nr:glycosyltransferase family 9 protein [Candidatus Nanoarchaeia archaeon]
MRICIIKLGAMGDVLRTLCVAEALKKEFEGCEIHWITKSNIAPLVKLCPFVDTVYSLPAVPSGNFDGLYCFDADEEAGAIAMKTSAGKKLGFYYQSGYPMSFNAGAEHYLNTMFDDALKKSNRKTYQEMMFEAAELHWKGERGAIVLGREEKEYAQQFWKEQGLEGKKVIGIHMGASPRWPSKVWHPDRLKECIMLLKGKGFEVLLFGGLDEREKLKGFWEGLKKQGIGVVCNHPDNSVREFAALVARCSVVIGSDSFALHVALSLGVRTVGLFFCTSPWEVEDYGLLDKMISPLLEQYFPERQDEYGEELVKSISAEQVVSLIARMQQQ